MLKQKIVGQKIRTKGKLKVRGLYVPWGLYENSTRGSALIRNN